MGVARLEVKAGWEQPFTGDTQLATLDFKGVILLPVVCRFSAQPDSWLQFPVGVKLS